MEYFAQYPTLLYTFDPDKLEYETVVDIFARPKVLDSVFQESLVFYQYPVQDGDSAWIIADKYYGDAKRHWMVFFANEVIDPYFDMPLNQADLLNNITLAYGSLSNAQANLYQVVQYTNVTTTIAGSSNTESFMSTLIEPYSYNFRTNQVEQITLPSIEFPYIPVSDNTVVNPDGSVVETVVSLVAMSAYDYLVAQNESKRQINLLDKKYAGAIENQLTELMSQ